MEQTNQTTVGALKAPKINGKVSTIVGATALFILCMVSVFWSGLIDKMESALKDDQSTLNKLGIDLDQLRELVNFLKNPNSTTPVFAGQISFQYMVYSTINGPIPMLNYVTTFFTGAVNTINLFVGNPLMTMFSHIRELSIWSLSPSNPVMKDTYAASIKFCMEQVLVKFPGLKNLEIKITPESVTEFVDSVKKTSSIIMVYQVSVCAIEHKKFISETIGCTPDQVENWAVAYNNGDVNNTEVNKTSELLRSHGHTDEYIILVYGGGSTNIKFEEVSNN